MPESQVILSNLSDKKPSHRPFCIFDLFLDLPDPDAQGEPALIIDPPVSVCPALSQEIYQPDTIAKLSWFAFPDYDDQREIPHTGDGRVLSKYDVYLNDFAAHHHTFSMSLSDRKTRIHGHVRRYLPQHADALQRADVGRRRPRAMVILTRATGGEEFYASLLKTAEAIIMESRVNKKGCFSKKKSPIRAFLHALFSNHANLIFKYAELERHGHGLNFNQNTLTNTSSEEKDYSEKAKNIMKQNENLFKISVEKIEFDYTASNKSYTESNLTIDNEVLSFHLPITLQPGYDCRALASLPEDIYSPITPLLQCIGTSHFLRLLSALLCERRIILISNNITRLSACVRAASSALAQGLLMWKHILIPVMPPHMLRFLSSKAIYLVGIPQQHMHRLSLIEGLTDVLCINIDSNDIITFNKVNERNTLPDMLQKGKDKKIDTEASAVEMLENDLNIIFLADQKLWDEEEKNGVNVNHKTKENVGKVSDASSDSARDECLANEFPKTRTSIMGKISRPVMKRQIPGPGKTSWSLEEKRQYATSVDAAVAFGKMIRSSFLKETGGGEFEPYTQDNNAIERAIPKYSPRSEQGLDVSYMTENASSEEDIRIALTCFFVHMYGDMGMYLSETRGTFWLNRRKFLLRKKQMGEKEDSPVFQVLLKFSSSSMFESFVMERIDAMSINSRERSRVLPHHIPLFDICSKYLSLNGLNFTLMNVRRIVGLTVAKCPRHIAVENSLKIRSLALALTSNAPHDGNVAIILSQLIHLCGECYSNLNITMSIIWNRLGRQKVNLWRQQLLSLHLLKTLLLHGPLTAITEALDGAYKIHRLKFFTNTKSTDSTREVRQAADQVYEYLSDLTRLYQRRRKIVLSKVQKISAIEAESFEPHIIKKQPFVTDGDIMHSLFSPLQLSKKVHDHVADLSSQGNPVSLLALQRLEQEHHESFYNTDQQYSLIVEPKDAEDSYHGRQHIHNQCPDLMTRKKTMTHDESDNKISSVSLNRAFALNGPRQTMLTTLKRSL